MQPPKPRLPLEKDIQWDGRERKSKQTIAHTEQCREADLLVHSGSAHAGSQVLVVAAHTEVGARQSKASATAAVAAAMVDLAMNACLPLERASLHPSWVGFSDAVGTHWNLQRFQTPGLSLRVICQIVGSGTEQIVKHAAVE